MKTNLAFLLCVVLVCAGCTKPKPPIIAQVTQEHLPGGIRNTLFDEGFLRMEGKVYNPNRVALINVKLRWNIYAPDGPLSEHFHKYGGKDACSVEIAYIPPLTTYDFKTDKIALRTHDMMRDLGHREPPKLASDRAPQIEFGAEK
ncbi:MAG: hypothetical protein FJ167_12245 [Gammaproteobacteria bacterium]|nr:hypothetical protein [Gammaproteobacteria bacterium]